MKEMVAALRSHYMWTLIPHYFTDGAGRRTKFSHYTYKCSGCGFDATTEDERHIHILEEVYLARSARV